MQASAVMKAIGAEMRLTRQSQGLTREQLVARLPKQINIRTLASYERGERECGLARFVEICQALEVQPSDVLAMALLRMQVTRTTRG